MSTVHTLNEMVTISSYREVSLFDDILKNQVFQIFVIIVPRGMCLCHTQLMNSFLVCVLQDHILIYELNNISLFVMYSSVKFGNVI